jgi:hypothetical protein
MQLAKFSATFFMDGAPLYAAGEYYPLTDDEVVRCVARGIAEVVNVDQDAEYAQLAMNKASAARAKATKARQVADELDAAASALEAEASQVTKALTAKLAGDDAAKAAAAEGAAKANAESVDA